RPVKESVAGPDPARHIASQAHCFKAFRMQADPQSRAMTARRSGPLRGTASVPGDKSISPLALILAAMTVGETRISGLLDAADVLNSAWAMRALGGDLLRDADGEWQVWGPGVGGLCEPEAALDCGITGTGSRWVMGAVATPPLTAVFTGDDSLRRRPM